MADEMIGLLVGAKEAIDAARATGADHLDAKPLHSIRIPYGTLIQKGWAANPEPEVGKRAGYERKAFNLLTRLDTQRADALRFSSRHRPSIRISFGDERQSVCDA